MIDIHSHLIPDFDDGSSSLHESRDLIFESCKNGVTDIICTPHYMGMGEYQKSYYETELAFKQLCEGIEDLPINMHLGNEIFYTKECISDALDAKKYHTLANSNYCLFELKFTNYDEEVINEVYDLNACGYLPILAHPERYYYVQKDMNLVYELVKEGCLMQVNADSILGYNGKDAQKTVFKLIEHNLVHFVASDAHNSERRINLKEAFEVIDQKFGEKIADKLFIINPKKILDNELIDLDEYTKVSKKGLFGIFSK
ncbi:MAG: CpsB/CapC family capsule biosynthesis tyrosine phosphatase [Anaerorhabdus sp.]|uniref:tyrosine-protein phosphatase n=1 Tax=Anaerorhabdus sp. TaxID=1872524 RepID=UPI002FCA8443